MLLFSAPKSLFDGVLELNHRCYCVGITLTVHIHHKFITQSPASLSVIAIMVVRISLLSVRLS